MTKREDPQQPFFGGDKTFVIAELSANHNHSLDIAIKTIRAMAESGADAVKLQTYTADTITIDCDNDYFRIRQGTIWDGKTLYKLYQEAYTPWEWHAELKKTAEDLGLVFFSSPFDFTAVDFLEKLGVPAYKIASFEITDIPLIRYVAARKKPILISTGIAGLADIEEALNACRMEGNDQFCLLKCTSSYPAPIGEANLSVIPNLAETFGCPVGISDHTPGQTVSVAAVALGARVVEKHFILDRNMGGPDATFSMEPGEFAAMVKAIRDVEKALGRIDYSLSPQAVKNREFSRSLFVVKDAAAGETLTGAHVRSIRPGFGLHPRHYAEVIGKKARRALKRGEPLAWEMLE
jgi:pseudaminic acid synthase